MLRNATRELGRAWRAPQLAACQSLPRTRSLSLGKYRYAQSSLNVDTRRSREPRRDDEGLARQRPPRRSRLGHGSPRADLEAVIGKLGALGGGPEAQHRHIALERERFPLSTGDLKRQLVAEKLEEERKEIFDDSRGILEHRKMHLATDSSLQEEYAREEVGHNREPSSDYSIDNTSSPTKTTLPERHAEEEVEDVEDWYSDKRLRRKMERRLQLSKSWEKKSPNLLLKSLLITKVGDYELLKKAAMARSIRMPVVLMQMMIRTKELERMGSAELLDLLPDTDTWETILSVLESNGHTRKHLNHYLYILDCSNDQERCQRFLEHQSLKPIWLLNFIIRRHSEISRPETLAQLMNYFGDWYCGMKKGAPKQNTISQEAEKGAAVSTHGMTPEAFRHASTLFAHHCMRLEPRLLVKLAELVAQYVRTLRAPPESSRLLYHRQCTVFNHALQLFQPIAHLVGQRANIPNSYLWEAQRILLDASGGLPKPLLLSKGGFRAIRAVLAGLPKDQAEKHNASLHSETWPPYLRPGDGMDETRDPDEGWARTIRAGMMMQEAGFPKEEVDEALDTLQGLAPDFTPTIQQRIAVAPSKTLTVWAASIKATRNASEAWAVFQQPPKVGMVPGEDEYTAMLEKLVSREVDPHTDGLPGDNALNYPTHEEPNLADFERARLKPPSIHELYEKMRSSGVKTNNRCLVILLSNAESLDTAHRYLLESETDWSHCTALLSDDPDPNALKDLPLSLFSAYITACAREGKGAGRQLARAIRLITLRLGHKSTSWNSFVWAPIFKNLGQHHSSLGLTLEQQLGLVLELMHRIQLHNDIPVPLFHHFNRCIQRIMRRESRRLTECLGLGASRASDDLILLYDEEAKQHKEAYDQAKTMRVTELPVMPEMPPSSGLEKLSPLVLFTLAGVQMKKLFYNLVTREKQIQPTVNAKEVSALNKMLSRRDPVKSTFAYDYVLSLAYLGEFQETSNVVKWLIQEWGRPNLVDEMRQLEHVPQEADMFDTLCAFRAFAEPMLPEAEAVSVMDAMNATELSWVWPDEEMVEAYVNGRRGDEPHDELRRLLQWTEHQRLKREQQTTGPNPLSEERTGCI